MHFRLSKYLQMINFKKKVVTEFLLAKIFGKYSSQKTIHLQLKFNMFS